MSRMYNPPHPGRIVKSILLEGAELSVANAAVHLGITSAALSKFMNCKSNMNGDMAMRLSLALNTSVELWLNLQQNYDFWVASQMRKELKKEVSRINKPKTVHTKMKPKAAITKIKKK